MDASSTRFERDRGHRDQIEADLDLEAKDAASSEPRAENGTQSDGKEARLVPNARASVNEIRDQAKIVRSSWRPNTTMTAEKKH